jgi:hypothetical protein
VEKVSQQSGLVFYYQKVAQSKQSPKRAKLAQSGHPVFGWLTNLNAFLDDLFCEEVWLVEEDDEGLQFEELVVDDGREQLGSILWNRLGQILRIKPNLFKYKFVIMTLQIWLK